jgi:hypothetical protein
MLYDKQSLTRIFKLMEGQRDRLSDAIDVAAQGVPLGFKALDDEAFLQMCLQQIMASPPCIIIDPEGNVREASPWLVMLNECENGPEILRRFERASGLAPAKGGY